MNRELRDTAERVLRAWNRYEVERGAHPVIDYDCFPTDAEVPAVENRLDALHQLIDLKNVASATGETALATRIDADISYCSALLGQHEPLEQYVLRTQGSAPRGWSEDYLHAHRERAQRHLNAVGIEWGPKSVSDLMAVEEILDGSDIEGAIRDSATELETSVRNATGSTADYELSIESTDLDVYWSYWLDGAGQKTRLRINRRNARFTKVLARQFALHEVLGHALQFASISAHCAQQDVPWIRLQAVHAPSQTLFEGLAQALPLFVAADDEQLTARVRLDHYQQLVRGQLHIALANGEPLSELADQARRYVPFWTDTQIADLLTDRGSNVLLRSYLWSYSAGIDWFVRLADSASDALAREVLHAAYRAPHTPAQLMELWPAGPIVGGE
ncbi:hypothetical protein [Nocardia sp. CY41]|uniref:hypothetical protein n=1 Tax=Nocardia sp. CY41 TaxID=2608686 RepID=UPI001915BD9C|nr:hypothetical protein [Nocardia sp. CY41]